MTQTENQAGLSFTNFKLKIVELTNSESGFTVENVDEAYFGEPLDFAKDKETKIFSVMQNAYNELIIKKPKNFSSVSIALPFELFQIMHIPYDNSLLHQDLIEEFRWEFSVVYPFIDTKDLVIQYFEIEKNSFYDYNTAITLGAPRRFLRFVYGFCEKNDLTLKFVDNSHFASERALSLNNPLMLKGLTLSVYISGKYLSLLYMFRGKPIHCKFVNIADASQIAPAIRDEINVHGFLKGNKEILDGAFITGDDISDSMVRSLNELTEIDFVKFNPFESLSFNPELSKNRNFSDNSNSFSSAAGIAYRLA